MEILNGVSAVFESAAGARRAVRQVVQAAKRRLCRVWPRQVSWKNFVDSWMSSRLALVLHHPVRRSRTWRKSPSRTMGSRGQRKLTQLLLP